MVLSSYMMTLGINISEVTYKEALAKAGEFLNSSGQYKIFTPNPEMVVKAQKDEYFRQVLNSGDLNLCDGRGLEIVSKAKRIPGVDFMLDICKLASEQGRSIFLLGSGSDEVVKKTAENLQKQFPNLKIAGCDKGPQISECHCERSEAIPWIGSDSNGIAAPSRFTGLLAMTKNANDQLLNKINACKPNILFVAFGMGKQEKWICENLAKIPPVKIAMGIGGAFDYTSGSVSRAPLFLRKIGLEWMYRLIREPKRAGRIFNATVKFIYLVLKSKLQISNVKSNPYD